MIIFLYGPDDYRRAQRKKFYIEEFKKKYSGISVGYYDFDSASLAGEADVLEKLVEFLRGQSLFEEKKLAVLENLSGAFPRKSGHADEKKLVEALKPIVAKKTTICLMSESKKPPSAIERLLKEKPSFAEEFGNLAGAEWTAFIKKEAGIRGAALSPEAVGFLAEIYKNNSWGLITELDKLSGFTPKGGPSDNFKKPAVRGSREIIYKKATIGGGEISRDDLESLGLETMPNYWEMMNGLRGQRPEVRLRALERVLAQKEPPAKVFNILASLWKEKTPQMAEYDFMVKSGRLEYEEALVDAIINF